jgi:hypothetical protein
VKAVVLALALALGAATIAPAHAQAPAPSPEGTLTAQDVLARSKAATDSDNRPETEREAWTTHVAGLDGSLDVIRHGDDMQTETIAGPFKTAHGIAHGQRWHQN